MTKASRTHIKQTRNERDLTKTTLQDAEHCCYKLASAMLGGLTLLLVSVIRFAALLWTRKKRHLLNFVMALFANTFRYLLVA